jgi:hypothetical protein
VSVDIIAGELIDRGSHAYFLRDSVVGLSVVHVRTPTGWKGCGGWQSFAAADGHSQVRARIPKERNKRRTGNRMVYNDWGLYSFVQMLAYRCLRFGKQLSIIDERNTSKTLHVLKSRVDVVAVQFSKGGKLEEIRVYQHAVTADSQ